MASHDPGVTGIPSKFQYDRVTRSGRHFHYALNVRQQPERARACGSGPKSSADRRPVDPPPIVSMNVYEGEIGGEMRDITMDLNADYFLFATLENARPMAHGRMQTPATSSPPVLTGVPVSACCYLDRPASAGYFLFPDLSVRHEGTYKLIFRLYERSKDAGDLPNPQDHLETVEDDEGLYFSFLQEIRSNEFTVFSAKKFPGLAESTSLSRTVAEQGCRVRIRRDVRMRRRETKGNTNEFDQRDDEYARDRRNHSPADSYRHRSSSHSSDRRPSGYEPIAPNSRVLNFAPPSFQKPTYQAPLPPPPPPSEPASPVTRTPMYHRQPSFGGPAYPPTPTYSHPHPYAERPPVPAHEDRRSSLPYPPMSQISYGSTHVRPQIPPIDTGMRERELPPIKQELKLERIESPNTVALGVGSSYTAFAMASASSLKRQFQIDDIDMSEEKGGNPMLEYKRAGGNPTEKQAPGYCDEQMLFPKIDPRLQAEDDRKPSLQFSRKRTYNHCS